MRINCGKWMGCGVRAGMLLAVTAGVSMGRVWGQTPAGSETKGSVPEKEAAKPLILETFYLTNVTQQNEGSEITTAIRNMISPMARVWFAQTQSALIVRTDAEELALVRKLIEDLDRPRKTYRLTYTITDADGGKRVGVQHFAMVVVSGQRTTMKQGSRVPVVTGSYDPGKSSANSQMSYMDVGLNFDATLDESASGVRLRTKAEQSSVAPETSGVGAQDPVVRQTMLEGTSILTPGKALVLGSLDVPGSTRHQEVEVLVEVVK